MHYFQTKSIITFIHPKKGKIKSSYRNLGVFPGAWATRLQAETVAEVRRLGNCKWNFTLLQRDGLVMPDRLSLVNLQKYSRQAHMINIHHLTEMVREWKRDWDEYVNSAE